MNLKISKAIEELLDADIQTISAESKEVLYCLFETDGGRELFDKWLQESPPVMDVDISTVNFEQIYNNIANHLYKEEQEKNRKNIVEKFVVGYQKIAAALIVPLIIGAAVLVYYLSNQVSVLELDLDAIANLEQTTSGVINVEYRSPAGSRLDIILPDSTEVCLNGNSKLTVSKLFGIEDRVVRVDGEAYFSVAPDKNKKFVVKAGDLDIVALGTSFYLKAYSDENSVETVLLTGKIAIELPDQTKSDSSILLYPNQKYIYYKNSKEEEFLKGINVEKYKVWTDGELIFEDESIEQIIERLERFYNVDIEIVDKDILLYRFTASLNNCSLEQILQYMKLSSPIDYEIDRNSVRLFTIK